MANNNNYLELLINLGVSDKESRKNINDYINQLKNLDPVKINLEIDGASSSQKTIH